MADEENSNEVKKEVLDFRGESKDCVSDLEDCILVSILMLLDTKDAIKTSILSRRWRYLWEMRPELKFDQLNLLGSNLQLDKSDPLLYYEQIKPHRCEFVRRVDHIMRLYNEGRRDIRSLKVMFFLDSDYSSTIDRWIRKAITAGVEEIELLLTDKPIQGFFFFPDRKHYNFPYWLFSKPSASVLKDLNLHTCFLRHPDTPGDFGGLRNLKTLRLHQVIVADVFLARLFSECKLLDELTLRNCPSVTKLHVVGSSLRLVHLKVLNCNNIEDFEISAPNLTTFEFMGNVLKISSFEAPSLAKMFFDTLGNRTTYAFTLFRNLPRLETFKLQVRPYKGIRMANSISSFRSLKQLELYYEGGDLSGVLSILKASPLLQEFTLKFFPVGFDENQAVQMQNFGGGTTHNQLKRVEIAGCVGNWYEIEFAKFVLRAATNLERMVISPHKRFYKGDGKWLDLEVFSYWYESHREMVRALVQDEVPVGVQFTVL